MHTLRYSRPAKSFREAIAAFFQPRKFEQTVELPSKWNEMTDQQIIEVAQILYGEKSGSSIQHLLVLKALLKWPDEIWNRLTAEQVWDMSRNIRWIWETPISYAALKTFTFKNVTFHLPDDGLKNMVAIEFALAEQHIKAFVTDQSGQSLNRLVATICRPEKMLLNVNDVEYDGDRREKFNSDIAERRADAFRSMDVGLRMAIMQWYMGQLRSLQRSFPIVYEKGEEPAPGATKRNPLEGFGMLAILMDLADQGPFGDFEKVCFTNIYTILTYLTKKKIEHEEREREQRMTKASAR